MIDRAPINQRIDYEREVEDLDVPRPGANGSSKAGCCGARQPAAKDRRSSERGAAKQRLTGPAVVSFPVFA
jgi:hypothetical protein